jgi:tRNA pseudouridine55 synthase
MMQSRILNIDKPCGMSSHDIVAIARKRFGLRAVGHTGTLDPAASGVLLLCLGRATKFARFFEALDKIYWAVLELGTCTDTQDATGKVTRTCAVPPVHPEQVEGVLDRFRGPVEQVPPMYSAVKHQGQRLYKLAHRGQVVKREPRQVYIRRLELLHIQGPRLTLSITCSKGTYIRTLCEDIGLALGYGAHMVALQRCRIGGFSLAHAASLACLRPQAGAHTEVCMMRGMSPLSHALTFLPSLMLTPPQYQAVRTDQGRALPMILSSVHAPLLTSPSYRLCLPHDRTVAVMHRQTPERWKLYRLENEETYYACDE